MAYVSFVASSHSAFSKFFKTAAAGVCTWSPYAGLTQKAILLDLIERIFLCAVFSQFAFRIVMDAHAQIESVLLIVSETLPIFLILTRLPSQTLSDSRGDWIFGLLGAVGPLLILVVPSGTPFEVPIGYAITIFGIAVQVSAKICLGRSFGIIAANRGVKVAGPYRFVRHPMYAGYIATYIGILLMMPSVINATIYVIVSAIHVVRILREERVLKQDAVYREFTTQVRYRLLPGIF
jgi:protein-S-isoprenylcysteine O-methyltransferase Ste14